MEDRTGFLVPAGDVPALAGRVLDLLGDEGRWLRIGRDAPRRFGVERMGGEYLDFYQASFEGEGI